MDYVVIRLSSIGDILLTTPLLRCIKKAFPTDARITFITKPSFAEILENNPYIDSVLSYNKAMDVSVFRDSRVIDLQNNKRSRALRKQIDGECVKYYKHNFEKYLLVHFKIDMLERTPVPQKYIAAATPFGIKDDGGGLEFWLPEEKPLGYYPPEKRLPIDANVFAIAPGAKHKTKQWLAEYWTELIAMLNNRYVNARFVLLGGAEDAEIGEQIVGDNIDNRIGTTSLIDTARLLDKSTLLLTNDTGVMHIGAARRVPIVAMFGSTVSSFGFAPYGTTATICEANVRCRPCSHIGKEHCHRLTEKMKCMREVTPGMVFKTIEECKR